MNKRIFLILFLGVMIVLIFTWIKPQPSTNSDQSQPNEIVVLGEVVNVDLQQVALDGPALVEMRNQNNEIHTIAVPSMGLRLCAAADNIISPWELNPGDQIEVKGSVNESGEIVPCENPDQYLRGSRIYRDEAGGFSFNYRLGPDGYYIQQNPIQNERITDLSLFKVADRQVLDSEGTEEPPHLAIKVYENTNKMSAAVWSMSFPELSLEQIAITNVNETAVAGANAVVFTADGLWQSQQFVIAHDSKIYLINIPQVKDYQNDFEAVLASFSFIETSLDN